MANSSQINGGLSHSRLTNKTKFNFLKHFLQTRKFSKHFKRKWSNHRIRRFGFKQNQWLRGFCVIDISIKSINALILECSWYSPSILIILRFLDFVWIRTIWFYDRTIFFYKHLENSKLSKIIELIVHTSLSLMDLTMGPSLLSTTPLYH